MPVYRGSDGKIIEESTRSISSSQNKSKTSGNVEDKTRKLSSKPVPPTNSDEANKPKPPQSTKPADNISGDTMIYKGEKPDSHREENALDPVVGWLVVIDGAGKGSDFSLGYGANSIGRGDSERVALNFGDKQISRNSHATLTYDPKSSKFYIQGGGGRNLTYMNDEVVLTPIDLEDGAVIQVGETKLKFVGFCGADFNW